MYAQEGSYTENQIRKQQNMYGNLMKKISAIKTVCVFVINSSSSVKTANIPENPKIFHRYFKLSSSISDTVSRACLTTSTQINLSRWTAKRGEGGKGPKWCSRSGGRAEHSSVNYSVVYGEKRGCNSASAAAPPSLYDPHGPRWRAAARWHGRASRRASMCLGAMFHILS